MEGEMEIGDQKNKKRKGKASLSPYLFPLPLSSPLECRHITTSLLSPRVLAGGNMNCVLDNMSNRYTQYVCVCIGVSACLHV